MLACGVHVSIRVLLIAQHCNPDWVSIALEGWSHSQALRQVAEVHMVTHARNRANLCRAGLVEGDHFTAFDTQATDSLVHWTTVLLGVPYGSNQGWTTLTALARISYRHFEQITWRAFGPRIRAGGFDIVHRITPLSPTLPSVFAPRCARAGVPFVLGPLNGGLPWPPGYGHLRAREKEWLSYVRGVHTWLPGYHSTRAAAAALVAGSRATREEIPARYASKVVYVPENAIEPERFDHPAEGPVQLPLRVVYVGRLVPYKGADMLLEAAAPLARAGKVRLDLIGNGPEERGLRALAEAEQMTSAVQFAGWVDHRELESRMRRGHVFGFPSVREFGGAVILEAMALGLVPIVVDYGGPGELVSPGTGFALPMGPREDLVRRLRSTLGSLVADPGTIRPMGERARQRVLRSFTWAAKAAQVAEVYRWVLGQRKKPDFGMPLSDPV